MLKSAPLLCIGSPALIEWDVWHICGMECRGKELHGRYFVSCWTCNIFSLSSPTSLFRVLHSFSPCNHKESGFVTVFLRFFPSFLLQFSFYMNKIQFGISCEFLIQIIEGYRLKKYYDHGWLYVGPCVCVCHACSKAFLPEIQAQQQLPLFVSLFAHCLTTFHLISGDYDQSIHHEGDYTWICHWRTCGGHSGEDWHLLYLPPQSYTFSHTLIPTPILAPTQWLLSLTQSH